MTAAIMVQGTGSNVGKSLIVAGLCRAFTRRGLTVRPFKPQNMSNNAAATADGGEIGRAQALQALACGVAPSVHMNPILLKPESEAGAQVIVQGKRVATLKARAYAAQRSQYLAPVLESYRSLSAEADLVIVEGAGSPAETNLRQDDIANMGFAIAAGVPVVLIGDIDRGGVIASLVGTHTVLDDSDRAQVAAFLINRFRGDPSLFDDGLTEIERRTGWPSLGVVPGFADAGLLPAEDTLGLVSGPRREQAAVRIVVPQIGRIANFDDLDPLRLEPGVAIEIIKPGQPLPGDADIVLLPGSKSTIADLADLRAQGWDIDIAAHYRRGGGVIGICGGYQMLGATIADPDGIEGPPCRVDGLGLLDIQTVLGGDKTTRPAAGTHRASGLPIRGYEIHLGRTEGDDCARPFATIEGQADGATSPDGRVIGTYLHGMFADDRFRAWFLRERGGRSGLSYDHKMDTVLDDLADHLQEHLDLNRLLQIAGTASS